MSLLFSKETWPSTLVAKSLNGLWLSHSGGMISLTMEEFCKVIEYYLFSNECCYELNNLSFSFSTEQVVISEAGNVFAKIATDDFDALVTYVMTNTNLVYSDPREKIIDLVVMEDKNPREAAKSLYSWIFTGQIIEGFPQWPPVSDSRRFADKNGHSTFGW
jgi:hypothetical protein